jgi:hypothetical protein
LGWGLRKLVIAPTYACFERICDIAYTYLQKFMPAKIWDTVNVSQLSQLPIRNPHSKNP